MDIGAWIKEHPYEAGGIGVVTLVILYYWFFSGSSSSGSSDLASYYNAAAAQTAAGAQQQALQSQLAAASQYYTTQGQVATTTSANDLAAQQAIATAQVQEAQAQAQAADVAARTAAKVGIVQANDALTAVQAATTPQVLASNDYLAFLAAFAGTQSATPTFATAGASGTSSTNLVSGIATTGGGIYGQALAVGPGANALFPASISPGAFGAPGTPSGTLLNVPLGSTSQVQNPIGPQFLSAGAGGPGFGASGAGFFPNAFGAFIPQPTPQVSSYVPPS